MLKTKPNFKIDENYWIQQFHKKRLLKYLAAEETTVPEFLYYWGELNMIESHEKSTSIKTK